MLIRFDKRRIKKLRKLAAEPDVDLWALDEVHFQQHGSRCRMWVPPEIKEPVLLHRVVARRACKLFPSRQMDRIAGSTVECSSLLRMFDLGLRGLQ